jgi:hypothetical protein
VKGLLEACGSLREANCDHRECRRPASFGIIALECWPASVCILRPQEQIDRLVTSRSLIVSQAHQRVASRFDSGGPAITVCPSATGECACFDLRLKLFQKAPEENESFQTENLSIDTHTW